MFIAVTKFPSGHVNFGKYTISPADIWTFLYCFFSKPCIRIIKVFENAFSTFFWWLKTNFTEIFKIILSCSLNCNQSLFFAALYPSIWISNKSMLYVSDLAYIIYENDLKETYLYIGDTILHRNLCLCYELLNKAE